RRRKFFTPLCAKRPSKPPPARRRAIGSGFFSMRAGVVSKRASKACTPKMSILNRTSLRLGRRRRSKSSSLNNWRPGFPAHPIREERVDDRALRMALHRACKTEAFAIQQDFDKAATALVQAIPIPQEITDWIPTDTFIAPTRRPWKKYAQNPAFLATGIAILVIAVVVIFQLVDRMNRFPGEPTARRL